MSSLTAPLEWQHLAARYLLQGSYTQAANLYEQAITAEDNVKSHYWHLGLILLLQGQEVEAQTTWFMAMVDGKPEQVDLWNQELVQVLQTEAERREEVKEYSIACKIRQQIKDFLPTGIENIVSLIKLSINLNTYTVEDSSIIELIEVLQLEPRVKVDFEILMHGLQIILDYAPFYPSSIELLEAILPHAKNNTHKLLCVLLPASVDIAYSRKQPVIAARIGELYLSLDSKNTEFLGHLATFYQNSGEYDKGIETARLFYSLVEELPDKIYANRQVIRGLTSAGGYWRKSYSASVFQESLLLSLIQNNPDNLTQARILRLFNSNFFKPYFEDKPRDFRHIQNQLMQVCQANIEIYAKNQVEQYIQGNLERKKLDLPTKKIKIGYLSHCLRTHSVGWLSRWVFQHHDRGRFQINAYFVNTNPSFDALHQWFIGQCDKTYKSNNIFDTAEQIYQDEVDILIDLDSITLDTTCEIMARKPAPIQVTWLGWDASGIPNIDYFIADPYVLPESAEEYYSEKIWRLPQTYIAVDGFEVSVPSIRRDQLDIPNDAVIYFSGQRGVKRHPDTTRLQLKIIKEVTNSYFLIKGTADEASIKNFFDRLADEEGVDRDRFRFLPDVYLESIHRANLGIADVVLDTYPYNGATTTLETLWMCIPLVTRVGEQFAARNSYTMMMNAGITEGIAWTDEEYIEWGVRLGKDASLRQQISWKMRQSRQTAPLWNAKQFTRDIEKAYEQMWQKYVEEC